MVLIQCHCLQCAKKFGIDFSAIAECMNSTYGNLYEHGMAMLTELLNPPMTFVPWVTLNWVMCQQLFFSISTGIRALYVQFFDKSTHTFCVIYWHVFLLEFTCIYALICVICTC